PGSRRSRCAWVGWGRLKKLPASTRKQKSKNWASVSFGSTSPSSLRSGIRYNAENARLRFRKLSKVGLSQRSSSRPLLCLVHRKTNSERIAKNMTSSFLSQKGKARPSRRLTSLKSSAFVNLHLVINGPNEFAKDHQAQTH